MKKIDVLKIEKEVEKLFIESNYILPDEIKKKLNNAFKNENNENSKKTLEILIKNYKKSEEMIFPLCQDTGMAIVFLEIGQNVNITGGYIIDAINNGIKNAYKNGYLRKSIVNDSIKRKNTENNLPAIIHTEITNTDKLKITVVPKGFGSENQSALKMMVPADGKKGIIDFIVNGVISSGSKGCPPCIIGIGIGGNFEYSAMLAKKALLLPLDKKNPDPFYAEMEEEILKRINNSNIGSMGLGGKITCLGVNIISYPTHIAGMPVAYNYCCHSCRHKSVVL